MNASPADQRTILEVADIDRRLAQAETTRKNPPQAARISELAAVRQSQTHELTIRTGARDDITSEIARIESDVEVARTRRTRDQELLNATSDP